MKKTNKNGQINRIMTWMWMNLEFLQPIANKEKFGIAWRKMILEKSWESAKLEMDDPKVETVVGNDWKSETIRCANKALWEVKLALSLYEKGEFKRATTFAASAVKWITGAVENG